MKYELVNSDTINECQKSSQGYHLTHVEDKDIPEGKRIDIDDLIDK